MLVLSRTTGESIHIGPDVTVTIIDVRGDRVRVGIEAPRDVVVHRHEVLVAIQKREQEGGDRA